MPRPRKHERVVCQYFVWLLKQRNGVWRADGRSNRIDVGRRSLGTQDLDEARRQLIRLDIAMAVRHGLVDAGTINVDKRRELSLEDGRRLYEKHVGRDRLVGGTRPSTQKRYRPVFDKFLPFAATKGLTLWNQVTAQTLEEYLSYLKDEDYAYRTRCLEATTLKQAVAWLVQQKKLPAECRIVLPLSKAQGSDTYCWRPAEVRAIIGHCRSTLALGWLADVIVALTYTGLRISELIGLRWSDIVLDSGMIRLVDESTSRRQEDNRPARTLKGGYGRKFPIHKELLAVLKTISRNRDGFVFHGPAGGRLKADTVRRALVREVLTPLAERFPTPEGEVGFAQGRLHSFRHFFCSLCASTPGVTQWVVMRWLGHRDSKMVEHYFHLHDDEARRQMRQIVLPDNTDGA